MVLPARQEQRVRGREQRAHQEGGDRERATRRAAEGAEQRRHHARRDHRVTAHALRARPVLVGRERPRRADAHQRVALEARQHEADRHVEESEEDPQHAADRRAGDDRAIEDEHLDPDHEGRRERREQRRRSLAQALPLGGRQEPRKEPQERPQPERHRRTEGRRQGPGHPAVRCAREIEVRGHERRQPLVDGGGERRAETDHTERDRIHSLQSHLSYLPKTWPRAQVARPRDRRGTTPLASSMSSLARSSSTFVCNV